MAAKVEKGTISYVRVPVDSSDGMEGTDGERVSLSDSEKVTGSLVVNAWKSDGTTKPSAEKVNAILAILRERKAQMRLPIWRAYAANLIHWAVKSGLSVPELTKLAAEDKFLEEVLIQTTSELLNATQTKQ